MDISLIGSNILSVATLGGLVYAAKIEYESTAEIIDSIFDYPKTINWAIEFYNSIGVFKPVNYFTNAYMLRTTADYFNILVDNGHFDDIDTTNIITTLDNLNNWTEE